MLRSEVAEPHDVDLALLSDAHSLYLGRCQVDTPQLVVARVWSLVATYRSGVGTIVDFGAGDGRFCPTETQFESYVGYEIDSRRFDNARLPKGAEIIARSAFEHDESDADIVVGNPPYVRNQDLPDGWRTQARQIIYERTGVSVPGHANAWIYFFLQSLHAAKHDGLVALVLPFEWTSRPSAEPLRRYLREQQWHVRVHQLEDNTFPGVMTTAAITIIDKAQRCVDWQYGDGGEQPVHQTATPRENDALLPYEGSTPSASRYARRGLSPGNQKVLTLTEAERMRFGLRLGRDVLPCVTSLKHLPPNVAHLDEEIFEKYFRGANVKCWLINTEVATLSLTLREYLTAVPQSERDTATCRNRDIWWRFAMPAIPAILVSQSFKGTKRPKAILNTVGARAVGGVANVYCRPDEASALLVRLRRLDLGDRVVPYANGLRKVEINQLNYLLSRMRVNNGIDRG